MWTIENRWNKGKSYKKHTYTIDDVARLRGVSIQTVRNYFSKYRLDIDSLQDVVKYLQQPKEGKWIYNGYYSDYHYKSGSK